ncbi:MAG: hypothetical protein ACXVK4_13325 [Acidimicrobiia bacterium]
MAGAPNPPGATPDRAVVNEWLAYHGRISGAMTAARTALESALIPVTAYIVVACLEAYRRYPDMMRHIAAAMDPAEIGATGRRPGSQVDAVHLWSIANLPLVIRQALAPFGMIDPADDLARLATIFDFWAPAALAFRGDGHHQAWDAGLAVPRYGDDVIAELLDGAVPVADDATRRQIAKTNALLTSFLFLLYFDTRAGYQDSGPYPLPDGRCVLVRDFNEFGVGYFPWSREVCGELPHANLTCAFVLDDVRVTANDWGTSTTDPVEYFERLERFAMFDSTGGVLTPVPVDALADLATLVKRAQAQLYRLIAGMSRKEKIDAGAFVYFTFLRPFALAAGVADELDWTVPRDSLDLYEAFSLIEGAPDAPPYDPEVPYYAPIP